MDSYNIVFDDYKYIKKICSNIRKINIENNDNADNYIKKQIKTLDYYYIKTIQSNKQTAKNIRILCLIENSIRKAVKKGSLNEIIDYYKTKDLKDLNNVSQVVFYLKYTNKKVETSINKYFIILKKLNILCGEFKRFVVLYIIFNEYKFDFNICKKLILSDIENKSLLYLLTGDKTPFSNLNFDASLIRVIRCIENYNLLNDIIIYDEDILKKVIKIKNSSVKISKTLNCDNVFESLVDNKIRSYRENNVTNKDIHFVKRFKFDIKVIQNTVFINSKLDKWYLDVDKKNNESILFHKNDGNNDKYHYQKTFNNTNLYKVFKYIKEHDNYCLNAYNKNQR